MKKLLRTIASTLLFMSLSTGLASADSISNTGPGSNNTITHNNQTSIDAKCDTNVDIDVDNNQNASSGNASVTGNTTGGGASSGNASNSNVINAALDINGCFSNRIVKPTPPAEEGPSEGRGGGGRVAGVSVTSEHFAALPETGSINPVLGYGAAATVGLGTVVGLVQLAIKSYRRYLLNL